MIGRGHDVVMHLSEDAVKVFGLVIQTDKQVAQFLGGFF